MTSRAMELARSLDDLWHEMVLKTQKCNSTIDEAAAELRRLAAIESAARNLVKVKGRYHTEQAFKALAATLENPHD